MNFATIFTKLTEILWAIIRLQDAQLALLHSRIAELERQLGLNSQNSSNPPSSDGLRREARVPRSLRAAYQTSGAQLGHEGKTLRQVADPDVVLDHYPAACEDCGATLAAGGETSYQKRQVFDLPEPKPLRVTEHRAHACGCPNCGKKNQAPFPENVTAPAQYGAAMTALVVYLQHWHFIPEDRLVQLMQDVFSVPLAAGTVGNIIAAQAKIFTPLAAAIGDQVRRAPVKNMDETGYRIGGKTQWLHVAATENLTFYHTSLRRGELLPGVSGIAVHDHWKPYFTMEGVTHALCNGHHLRELRALTEIEAEPWAQDMYRLLRHACHATNLARRRGAALKARFIRYLHERYDRILAQGLAFHAAQPPPVCWVTPRRKGPPRKRVGHNLLMRLQIRKDDVLRFLTHAEVPFTNNQAEQDLRMMKVKQKISGGFRSRAGADAFATLRSVLSTARKQRWNIMQTLAQDPTLLIQQIKTA